MSLLALNRCFYSVKQNLRRQSHVNAYVSAQRRAHLSSDASTKTRVITVKLLGDKVLHLEAGQYARFANATGICAMGDTSVMVTAVAKAQPSSSNFMPLTVDYRQKSAAAGRIPTNFLRRELGPSEKEILTARVIDRSLRPLFPADYRCETQLACNLLAIDALYHPDVLSINAASLSLALSDIPWNGPVAAVRVGLVKNDIVINPTRKEIHSSELDLIVTATKQNLIVMLEGRGNIVPMQDCMQAITIASRQCQRIIDAIDKLQKLHGKEKNAVEKPTPINEEITESIRLMSEMRLRQIFSNHGHDKMSRDRAVNEVRENVTKHVASANTDVNPMIIGNEFNRIAKHIFREIIFADGRCDGRGHNKLRPISCKVNMYKPLHGCSLFQRGQTQVLSTVSLDSVESAMKLDSMSSIDMGVKSKNFFLHYEFPPYATGEVGRMGPIGRREIGHGALAEKGIMPVIPNNHPFTIRLTAEVLESNGSSSMATVCGGSLALMDAGVPIKAPVAGVAIGLVTKYNDANPTELEDYRVLTDILGIEDYLGDMDLKIAGTKTGITAIQADIKTCGIPTKVISEALGKAHDARAAILHIMSKCINERRKNKKDCWPVSEKLSIEPHQRARLLGPGGIHIKKIFIDTGVQLSPLDDTTYTIFAPSQVAMDEAKEQIDELMKVEKVPELEFGGIYAAKIVEIKDIGVMVTLYPNMPPALLPTSQLDIRKVAHPSALNLEVGEEIQIKYFGRDPVSGFMRISRKVLQQKSVIGVARNLNETT